MKNIFTAYNECPITFCWIASTFSCQEKKIGSEKHIP